MATSSNLLFAATSSQTTLTLADTTNFPVDGGVVLIDSEKISFATATDRTLIGCTRGAEGTTPASHLINATVTLIETFPYAQTMGTSPSWVTVGMAMPVLSLLDPTAVPTAAQIEANTVITVNFDSSGVNQTWTLPTIAPANALMLVITHNASSAKTLTVNSGLIAPGSGQLFMWDGKAWYAC